MARVSYTINQRALIANIIASDGPLKREVDKILEAEYFLPAVQQLKEDFEKSEVTKEIRGGVDSPNISETLDRKFQVSKDDDTIPNLWGFIGFDAEKNSPAEALAPILSRLDHRHPDGPKLRYRRRDQTRIRYTYEIVGPNEDAIFADTGFEWMEGISWVKRIEQGISGINQFLNVRRPSSRSGGGIQVAGNLPNTGRYKPVPYLSQMFNNFLRNAGGRKANGRRARSSQIRL